MFNSNEATSVINIANHPKTGCVGLQFLGAFWRFDVLEERLPVEVEVVGADSGVGFKRPPPDHFKTNEQSNDR